MNSIKYLNKPIIFYSCFWKDKRNIQRKSFTVFTEKLDNYICHLQKKKIRKQCSNKKNYTLLRLCYCGDQPSSLNYYKKLIYNLLVYYNKIFAMR